MKDKHFYKALTRKLTSLHNKHGLAMRCMDGSEPSEFDRIVEVGDVEFLRVKGPELSRRKHIGTWLYNVDDRFKTPEYFIGTAYDQDEDASFVFLAMREENGVPIQERTQESGGRAEREGSSSLQSSDGRELEGPLQEEGEQAEEEFLCEDEGDEEEADQPEDCSRSELAYQ